MLVSEDRSPAGSSWPIAFLDKGHGCWTTTRTTSSKTVEPPYNRSCQAGVMSRVPAFVILIFAAATTVATEESLDSPFRPADSDPGLDCVRKSGLAHKHGGVTQLKESKYIFLKDMDRLYRRRLQHSKKESGRPQALFPLQMIGSAGELHSNGSHVGRGGPEGYGSLPAGQCAVRTAVDAGLQRELRFRPLHLPSRLCGAQRSLCHRGLEDECRAPTRGRCSSSPLLGHERADSPLCDCCLRSRVCDERRLERTTASKKFSKGLRLRSRLWHTVDWTLM